MEGTVICDRIKEARTVSVRTESRLDLRHLFQHLRPFPILGSEVPGNQAGSSQAGSAVNEAGAGYQRANGCR